MPENQNPVSLTIYNKGSSLVRERRTVDLKAGLNTWDVTDVTAAIIPSSVTFGAVDDPDSVAVLEQNYLYDLVDSHALLGRYLEQTIEIITDDGSTIAGELLNSSNTIGRKDGARAEIILRLEGGQIATFNLDRIRDIRFPSLPGGLITRPTLRWLLQSTKSGSQQIEITYLTNGIGWIADYNLLLAETNQTFDLSGWITLNNSSGKSFHEAQVKLVAGDLKRADTPVPVVAAQRMAFASLGAAPQQVEQREIFEYKLYEIQRPLDVAHNESKQVEFISAHQAPVQVLYMVGSPTQFGYVGKPTIEPERWNSTSEVQTWLEFTTGGEGLSKDLPAGQIRVYQRDQDGAGVLIGENSIKHTPKGEKIRLELGKAFDLVSERIQTHYRNPNKRSFEETYEIRLRNRKDKTPVQIRVYERMFRWRDWEIMKSSTVFSRLNVSVIEFRVDVPPGEEKVITYTVRYTWP